LDLISKEDEEVQKTLFQISSIFSNILAGLAYFSTSIPNNFQKIGNKKIEATVIINHKTAYLIVFIAGLILSSFHQDKINSKPQYNIKTIDNIQETKTKIEITNNTKSQNSILLENNGEAVVVVEYILACVTSIKDIFFYIINLKLSNLFFFKILIILFLEQF
jgi:hypothetical protein